MSHVYRLSVHRDGEGGGKHLLRDGRGLNMGDGMGLCGKDEYGDKQ
jgi:hypothetical protein